MTAPANLHLIDPGVWFLNNGGDLMWFGVYSCFMCERHYTVNHPMSWAPCTPDYCDDCCEMEMPC